MAYKEFALDEQTPLKIYKRRASRSVRLTIAPGGDIRVSIPAWAPYRVGLEFARSRRDWIERQRQPQGTLHDGQLIGKAHRLHFEASDAARVISTRLRQNSADVVYPATYSPDDPKVQAAAHKVSIRALRRQAEALLPRRLKELADRHGFQYRNVSIKQLKSRWGSCDQHGDIVLNLFLIQLPWDHIDYVLLHELTHTRIMRHGPDFWREMEVVLPGVKSVRKAMRAHQPALHSPVLTEE